MGLFTKIAGVDRRDQLTAKALAEAQSLSEQGLSQFTISLHSTHGGLAQLSSLTPHVVRELQTRGFEVIGVETQASAYNAHLTCRSAGRSVPLSTSQQGQAITWTVEIDLPNGETATYFDDRRHRAEDDLMKEALRYHHLIDPSSGALTIIETGMRFLPRPRVWEEDSPPRTCAGFSRDQWVAARDV